MKSLQAAAAAAIRRATGDGNGSSSTTGGTAAAAGNVMEGSQRAVIRDLSQKVSDLCRHLADARRQQHLAQACLLPESLAVAQIAASCPLCSKAEYFMQGAVLQDLSQNR